MCVSVRSMRKALREKMLEICEGYQVPSAGTIMSSSTYQARILGFLKKKKKEKNTQAYRFMKGMFSKTEGGGGGGGGGMGE